MTLEEKEKKVEEEDKNDKDIEDIPRYRNNFLTTTMSGALRVILDKLLLGKTTNNTRIETRTPRINRVKEDGKNYV